MSSTPEQLNPQEKVKQPAAKVIEMFPESVVEVPPSSKEASESVSEIALKTQEVMGELNHLYKPDNAQSQAPEPRESGLLSVESPAHKYNEGFSTSFLYTELIEPVTRGTWGKFRVKNTSWLLARAEARSQKLDNKAGRYARDIALVEEKIAKIMADKPEKAEKLFKLKDKLTDKHDDLVSRLIVRESTRERYRQQVETITNSLIDRIQIKFLPLNEEKRRWDSVSQRLGESISNYTRRIEELERNIKFSKAAKKLSPGAKSVWAEDIKELKQELAKAKKLKSKAISMQEIAKDKAEFAWSLAEPYQKKIDYYKKRLPKDQRAENAKPLMEVMEARHERKGRYSPAVYIKMWNEVCATRPKMTINHDRFAREMKLDGRPMTPAELGELVAAYLLKKKLYNQAFDSIKDKVAKRLEAYV